MEGLIPYVFEARATFDQTMNQLQSLVHNKGEKEKRNIDRNVRRYQNNICRLR